MVSVYMIAIFVKLANFYNSLKDEFIMFRKILLLLLLGGSFFIPDVAIGSIDLAKYNQLQLVSASLSYKEIKSKLKDTLGVDYDAFIENFDVFGPPHKTSDGGIFIEGWLNDLYLENASAFVIYPNGKVFAGWVTPDAQIINYKANNNERNEIHPAIKEWATRFKGMDFTLPKEKRGVGSEIDYFNTNKFMIKITTQCQPDGQCNDAIYQGVRKKDGAQLTLAGKASRSRCNSRQCPIFGYDFKNGQVVYMLSKINNSLTVISNNKIVLDEKGIWSNEIKANADSMQAIPESNFTGQWQGEDAAKSGLSLSLNQVGNALSGTYCYIAQAGNRIDCPPENEINIHGIVRNGKAEIVFNSSFGGKNGHAALELNGVQMKWKLTKPPVRGDYYAPLNYVLTRQTPATSSITREFSTNKFTVTITSHCGDFNAPCNDMSYLGVRRSDNSVMALKGKTLQNSAGEVVGAEFNNGNVSYKVAYKPVKLTVSEGDRVLVDQEGHYD